MFRSLQRITAVSAILCLTALASGALQYAHELDHARQDAVQDAKLKAAHIPVPVRHHDDSNCDICAQLHMAMMASGGIPLLVFLGLFVAFLTLPETPLIPRLLPARIDCRGPPLSYSSI
jgi:hypothetical protein